MFTPLFEHKIKAKRSKYEFTHLCVKYFGHMVGSGELCVDPDEVSAEVDWAVPQDNKGV